MFQKCSHQSQTEHMLWVHFKYVLYVITMKSLGSFNQSSQCSQHVITGFRPPHPQCERVDTACGHPLMLFQELSQHIKQENLVSLVWIFLFYQQNPSFTGTPSISACPTVELIEDISVFHSANAVFCTPSNPFSIGGLYPKMENKWHCSTLPQLYPAQN